MQCCVEFTVVFAPLSPDKVELWHESLNLMLDMLEQAECEFEMFGKEWPDSDFKA